MTRPFDYPTGGRRRRHGPRGYRDPDGYRDGVRDEYDFRSAYCLLRERWVPGGFHLDHLIPTTRDPSKRLAYENLRYACPVCNGRKQDRDVSDPLLAFSPRAVSVTPKGVLRPKTRSARRLIDQRGLNHENYQTFRRLWIRIAAVAAEVGADEAALILGYPDHLPNLSRLRPPGGNDRPEGIAESAYARREAGTLPTTY